MSLTSAIVKRSLYAAIFIAMVFLVSVLCQVHDKTVSPESYSGGVPVIMGLLNSEVFMAFAFCATVGFYILMQKEWALVKLL